ncbi:MAG: N-formylglutamate deformylase [Woeseiaceae bacterium]|nr:N-formylglutamate deformylase [Woeseiaceae bacterium]
MSHSVYRFHAGRLPLLISVPHDGRSVPDDIGRRMTASARALPDTDWHVARLYDFATEFGASLLVANFSRYVVDLNRPPDDRPLYPGQLATGLCPTATFSGLPLYRAGMSVTDDEREERVARYWRPYHERLATELARMRDDFGQACLWDAHSIASRVPSLFDGELPELNLGSHRGRSCGSAARAAVAAVAEQSDYSFVLDGRFTGGYITRHYGAPGQGMHALQLEIAQRAYMDEKSLSYDEDRASRLGATLKDLLGTFIAQAR